MKLRGFILIAIVTLLVVLAGCAKPQKPAIAIRPPAAAIPSVRADVASILDGLKIAKTSLADAIGRANELPPQTPGRDALLGSLATVGSSLVSVDGKAALMSQKVESQEQGIAQNAQLIVGLRTDVSALQKYSGELEAELKKKDNAFQQKLMWVEITIGLIAAAAVALAIYVKHDIGLAVGIGVCGAIVVVSLRMLGWIDEHKFQLTMYGLAACAVYVVGETIIRWTFAKPRITLLAAFITSIKTAPSQDLSDISAPADPAAVGPMASPTASASAAGGTFNLPETR